MVERPHQFLVVENRLGFRERCTTAFTDGSTDKIFCPTVGTELNDKLVLHPRKAAMSRLGLSTRSIASTGPDASTSAACSASIATPSPARIATPRAARRSIATSFLPL